MTTSRCRIGRCRWRTNREHLRADQRLCRVRRQRPQAVVRQPRLLPAPVRHDPQRPRADRRRGACKFQPPPPGRSSRSPWRAGRRDQVSNNNVVAFQPAVEAYGARSLTAADIRATANLMQDEMLEVMKDGSHYGTIPGTKTKS